MNIYELEKLATPGPVDGVQVMFYEVRLPHGTLTHLHPGEELARHDKRFDAHCRNNFMKALELVKMFAQYARDKDQIGQAQWVECRIKELETVV
jgi:hypothetical protein